MLNQYDLVAYRYLKLAQSGRQDHVHCSLSVEDANHELCASHDA